ncbi:hypothetical protein [Marivita lacus]|uniref:hypothetical protein n=1 Tax=Marivita lacus TaxID=1323742 RepID=UPI001666CC10|nr:hypothetical protein [Marivita lacus]
MTVLIKSAPFHAKHTFETSTKPESFDLRMAIRDALCIDCISRIELQAAAIR